MTPSTVFSAAFTALAAGMAYVAVARPHSPSLKAEAVAVAFAVLLAIAAVRS